MVRNAAGKRSTIPVVAAVVLGLAVLSFLCAIATALVHLSVLLMVPTLHLSGGKAMAFLVGTAAAGAFLALGAVALVAVALGMVPPEPGP
jgi:hypothetical protein